MTRAYRISDLVLASGIALPELPPAAADPDWTFTVTSSRSTRRPTDWFRRWTDGGRTVASFARTGSGYFVRFHRHADFTIDCAGRRIACSPRSSASVSTIRHLLLDQVIPLVLSRRRRLVLHAAAVATPAGAAAFIGPAGAGKSTLAAALAIAGFPLMTDDCLVVDPGRRSFVARSFYPGARLWPDSLARVTDKGRRSREVAHYTTKRRLGGDRLPYAMASMPLSRVFVLDPRRSRRVASGVVCSRLSGREAMLKLLACSFHLDTDDPDAARAAFELHGKLVESTPVHALSYPWGLARLRETCDDVGSVLITD